MSRPQVEELFRAAALSAVILSCCTAVAVAGGQPPPVPEADADELRHGEAQAQPAQGERPDHEERGHGEARRGQDERERADVLSAKLRAAGYDGVFFDTTTSASVRSPKRCSAHSISMTCG